MPEVTHNCISLCAGALANPDLLSSIGFSYCQFGEKAPYMVVSSPSCAQVTVFSKKNTFYWFFMKKAFDSHGAGGYTSAHVRGS